MNKILKLFNFCNFYMFVLTLYYFSQSLHIENPWIIRFLYITITLASVYYAIKVNKEKNNTLFLFINLFLIYILIHGIVYYFSDTTHYNYVTDSYINKIQFTTDVLFGFLPIYAIYYFTKRKKINEKWLIVYIVLYLLLSIVKYIDTAISFFTEHIYREGMTNNTSYEFVYLFPLLVFCRKYTIPQFLLLGVIMFFIISGAKRGAIIIGCACMLYFLYASYKSAVKSKFNYILVVLITLIFGFSFFQDFILNNDYLLERIEDTLSGNTSSRDLIYSKLWKYYMDSNIFIKTFGSGAYSTIAVAGNLAHQDWLELAVDCGFIGCVLYFYVYHSFRKTISFVNDYVLRSSLSLTLFIMFMKSIFSMSYSSFAIPLALSIGYCLAKNSDQDSCLISHR